MKVKYSFKSFIVNGLGADFVRICKLYHYCQHHGLELFMNEDDDWKIVPFPTKNWRSLFDSLEMTTLDLPEIDNTLLTTMMNYPVTFSELQTIVHELYKPNFPYTRVLPKGEYAVIHVRRGDKVHGTWKEGLFHSLDDYYNCLPSTEQVYVMTDSPDVYREALERGFQVDSQEIRRDGFVYRHHHQAYTMDEVYDEISTFFKNMHILQHGTTLVGSNSSYFFILGQLLNKKRGISLSNNLYYYVMDNT